MQSYEILYSNQIFLRVFVQNNDKKLVGLNMVVYL